MTTETSNARGEWPERYACNGPEGTFWTDDATLANKLIAAAFDRDEWTVTDTQNPTAAPPPASAQQQGQPAPPSAPVGVEAIAAEIRASLGRGATVSTRRRWAIELEALAQQPAAVAVDEAMVERACDAYVQIADDCMGLVRRKAMAAALTAALATQHQEPTT